MIILDTNVVSALMRPKPEPVVEEWLNGQSRADLWMNSVSLFELQFGLLTMEFVSRREAHNIILQRILSLFEDRVTTLDAAAAEQLSLGLCHILVARAA